MNKLGKKIMTIACDPSQAKGEYVDRQAAFCAGHRSALKSAAAMASATEDKLTDLNAALMHAENFLEDFLNEYTLSSKYAEMADATLALLKKTRGRQKKT